MNWHFLAFACVALITATLFSTLRRALYWLAGAAAAGVIASVIGGAILH